MVRIVVGLLAVALLFSFASSQQTTFIVVLKQDAVIQAALSAGYLPSGDVEAAAAAFQAPSRTTAAAAWHIPAIALLAASMKAEILENAPQILEARPFGVLLMSGFSVSLNCTGTCEGATLVKQHLASDHRVQDVFQSYPRTIAAVLPTDVQTAVKGSEVITGLSRIRSETADHLGTGIKIGIIDSGLQYRLPVSGRCAGVGQDGTSGDKCYVVAGYDFVGNLYDGTTRGQPAAEDADPDECMGHGTLVTNIAAGLNGVAPQASLGVYKVFGCTGDATDDVIIRAIERAVQDGMEIINLAMADRSGFPEGPYKDVVARAMQLGVIFVRSAGNFGGGGPFQADSYVATGGISVGSIDVPTGTSNIRASSFSSYGPAPTLELNPHLLAPGGGIITTNKYNQAQVASGTSMATAYMSGLAAIWLQHKRQQAAEQQLALAAEDVNQEQLLSDFMLTAQPILDLASIEEFYEPVAKAGAGLVQVHAALNQILRVSPNVVYIPSNLQKHEVSLELSVQRVTSLHEWSNITYDVQHLKAAAIKLRDGWYGSGGIKYYLAADATFDPPSIVVPTSGTSVLKATFDIPADLRDYALLYSGYIRLVPVFVDGSIRITDDLKLSPLVVPYQGYARNFSTIKATPRVIPETETSQVLVRHGNTLCYAPNSIMLMQGRPMDDVDTLRLCNGSSATTKNSIVPVSLAQLKPNPCALRIAVALEVPVRRISVRLLDWQYTELGLASVIDTPTRSRSESQTLSNFCTGFNGTYTEANTGKARSLAMGKLYRMRADLEGPTAAADQPTQPLIVKVFMRGMIKVTP